MMDAHAFAELTPNLSQTRRGQILPPLLEAFTRFQITTTLREAHAMAQLLHESGSFVFKREIASGAAYEGRADLGNTHPGDGPRYKGRGWIQVTGRFNYRKFGHILGIDLEDNPLLAETDENAALLACAYWDDRGLNRFADQDDILTITRRINGGTNGLADRKSKLVLAKSVLSADPPASEDQEEPFRVEVRGTVASNDAFMDHDNHLWVPLRAVTRLLGVDISGITDTGATLDSKGTSVAVSLVVRGSAGFTPARELADKLGLTIDFDGDQRVLKLS